MVIEAEYENGVFKPLGKIRLKEGTVVEIRVNSEPTASKAVSIRELGFAGMWADRADVKDGVSYVNSLRDNPRGSAQAQQMPYPRAADSQRLKKLT